MAAAVKEANRQAAEHLIPLTEEVAVLNRRLKSVEDKGRRLVSSLLEIEAEQTSFGKDALRELDQERRQLIQAVANAEAELSIQRNSSLDAALMTEALRGFDAAFDELTGSEKRELLALIIERVVVHPDNIEVHVFDGRYARSWLDGHDDQNDETPGVTQGFVTGTKWLPLLDSNQRHPD